MTLFLPTFSNLPAPLRPLARSVVGKLLWRKWALKRLDLHMEGYIFHQAFTKVKD